MREVVPAREPAGKMVHGSRERNGLVQFSVRDKRQWQMPVQSLSIKVNFTERALRCDRNQYPQSLNALYVKAQMVPCVWLPAPPPQIHTYIGTLNIHRTNMHRSIYCRSTTTQRQPKKVFRAQLNQKLCSRPFSTGVQRSAFRFAKQKHNNII